MTRTLSKSTAPLEEAAGPATTELVGAAAAAELLEPAEAAADTPAASAEAAIRRAAAACVARLRSRRICCGMAVRPSCSSCSTTEGESGSEPANLSRNGYGGVRPWLGPPQLPSLRREVCSRSNQARLLLYVTPTCD